MDIHVQATSRLYWIAALFALMMDVGLVALLAWRIKPARFRRLMRPLMGVAGIFWLALWSWAMWDPFVWETCYQFIFPVWIRPIWPIVMSLLNCGAALFFWWLVKRLPGNAVVNFIILGGIESFPGHLYAIKSGILDTPLLQNVNAASALTFGFFEFGFYWCIILSIASLFSWILEHRKQS